MHTHHNNHTEALVIFTTGKFLHGRPTLGAWVSYALGTENQNLPAFVALRDPNAYNNKGTRLWENGWLPALYRGTEFDSGAGRPPVLNLRPARPLPEGLQDDNLALLAERIWPSTLLSTGFWIGNVGLDWNRLEEVTAAQQTLMDATTYYLGVSALWSGAMMTTALKITDS